MSDNATPPLSARELAEQVLAFREVAALQNPRFHHRAMLVNNGGRGSDQKAMTFDADDLSALMMDLWGIEAERDGAYREFGAKFAMLERAIDALSESHAVEREEVFRAGFRASERMNDVEVDVNAEGEAVAAWRVTDMAGSNEPQVVTVRISGTPVMLHGREAIVPLDRIPKGRATKEQG